MIPFLYKGYRILKNDLNGIFWIEKHGSFIGYAKDRTDAMRIIDQLVEG